MSLDPDPQNFSSGSELTLSLNIIIVSSAMYILVELCPSIDSLSITGAARV